MGAGCAARLRVPAGRPNLGARLGALSAANDWPDWLTWPTLRAGVAVVPAPPERLRQRIETALLDMDGFARSALPRGTRHLLGGHPVTGAAELEPP